MAGKRIVAFTVFALLALALALFASRDSHAQSYKPFTGYSLADTTAGAASDSYTSVNIAVPDYNYGTATMVNFFPLDGWTATAAEIPIGEEVGLLTAEVRISMIAERILRPEEREHGHLRRARRSRDVLGPHGEPAARRPRGRARRPA